MWYIVLAEDNPGTLQQRLDSRAAHLARLNELNTQGRLKMAGPMPAIDDENPGDAGFVGSMLVVQFGSLAMAKQWADEDPYFAAGVYKRVQIFPYKPVLP